MIGVVKKAFIILEALASAGSPLALAELTRRTKLSKPTIYRILQSMCELRYAAQDEATGFYMRTTRLGQLGRNSHYHDLVRRIRPHMEQLHREFNETVNLAVLDGINVCYAHVLETTRGLRQMVQPNAVDEFYSTALGRAIVSYLDEDDQRSLIKQTKLQPLTPHTVGTKQELLEQLEQTRARGYAIDEEENEIGVVCFAVPLLENNFPIASVSISLPKIRLTPPIRAEIISALKAIKL